MPQVRIHPMGDEDMPGLLPRLDQMVEVTSRVGHCCCSHCLADQQKGEAEGEPCGVQRWRREEKVGEVGPVEEGFEGGAEVGDGVCASVVEEESGCVGAARVVDGCGVVFETVEERERGEEEGEAPVR